MSATPWNIRGSASQLFYQDKECPQYEAILAISELQHPDRSILSSFIDDAANPREAAEYFLRSVRKENDSSQYDKSAMLQFLSQWMTSTPFEMVSTFMSETTLNNVCGLFGGPTDEPQEQLGNIWLISKEAAEAIKKGAVYFKVQSWAKDPDINLGRTYNVRSNLLSTLSRSLGRLPMSITIRNRTPKQTPILNTELLALHASISKSLSWVEMKKLIDAKPNFLNESRQKFRRPTISPLLVFLLKEVLKLVPQLIRSYAYDKIIPVGLRLYGAPLSMTVFKLPFGLYLRRGSTKLADKYQAEAHTFQMVEQYTDIPAPQALDVLHISRYSYLLMTCVPGRPIGPMLDKMTDDQLKQVVVGLKRYVSQLRQIPRTASKPSEFLISNSKGGGILDWRIPDSQCEELRFKSETDLNKYLTDPFWDDIRKRAAKSHATPHDIVFTHGDLNPRNILAESGKITGIVDWENAGWFPEYWEYTKSHYAVRSVIHWLADVVDRVLRDIVTSSMWKICFLIY